MSTTWPTTQPTSSPARQWVGLLFWIGICFAAAWIGSRWTVTGPESWYARLEKPGFNPPNWVFGPVWSTLYLLMGIAAWLVWRERGFAGAGAALGLFLAQLALNVAWSGIFFGLQQPGWAFAEILLLWAAILATLSAFRRVRPLAGALLLPYLAWVTFASVLNGTIWRLNL